MNRKILVLLVLICMSGCIPMDPLTLPSAETVTMIEGRISNSYDLKTKKYIGSVEVRNTDRIKEIIDFLNRINNNMKTESTTYPTPTHTIIFTDTENVNLLIFLGLNWIGGRNNVEGNASDNRLRNISEAQREEFIGLLGIDDYKF